LISLRLDFGLARAIKKRLVHLGRKVAGQLLRQVLEPAGIGTALHVQPEPGQQNRRADRLGHIVCGTEVEATVFFFHAAKRGKKNNRNVRGAWVPFQAGENFVPIHPRHDNVQQNDFGTMLGQRHAQPDLTRWRKHDLVAVTQERGQQVANVLAVINDEDARTSWRTHGRALPLQFTPVRSACCTHASALPLSCPGRPGLSGQWAGSSARIALITAW
jgi:hypothetical protein